MATNSFVERLLEFTIKLGANPPAGAGGSGQPNKFAGTASDTITFSKHRATVRVENNSSPTASTADISIFGLPLDLMVQLQTLGRNFDQITRNTIVVSAGDVSAGVTPVFLGTILESYGDYNAAPKVPFVMHCQSTAADNVIPQQTSSFPGPTDVVAIMRSFATLMNLGFENNGVTGTLRNPVFSGNIWQQVQKCATHVHIRAERINGKLCIWPIGGARTSVTTVPLLNKTTGMIGYPIFWMQNGLIVKHIFNPQISFGARVRVQSDVAVMKNGQSVKIDGTYAVQKLDLALDTLTPHGQWMGVAHCFDPNRPSPIPQKV